MSAESSCPKCRAPGAVLTPLKGSALLGPLLASWQVWVFALVSMSVASILAGLLGFAPGTGGAGGGAATGLFIAIRAARLRKCPACAAVVTVPAKT